MKSLRKLVSFVLVFALVIGLVPIGHPMAQVQAQEEIVTSLRPKERTLWTSTVSEWEPGADPNDALNKASVPLQDRIRGHVINPLASDEAKVQVLALMNSKAQSRSSVGAEGFKLYAFDNWQYTDSMIYWDGVIPTPDVIDAGHRNGVPVYGTLFFNWSSSAQDNRIFADFIEKRADGTFPKAEKLVDIAKYYGFDGYFINQETVGSLTYGKGEDMRNFMLYAKEYAKEQNYPIHFSWYDAMDNNGGRTHYNAVTSGNDSYVKPDGEGNVPADQFFMNFNWSSTGTTNTANHMASVGRSPYDAYAGFELQQASINTSINFAGLTGEDGKAKLSIGLFTPDSILGFSDSGEDYHIKENNFWTGYEGDPSISADSHRWKGMSRFVSDSTPVTSLPFKTFFNTGHGKYWFEEGELNKTYDWNARGISEVLPTWRWWIKSDAEIKLQGNYDFEKAYYGGSSVKFEGDLTTDNQEIMLYSTKLPVSGSTKLDIVTAGGEGANLKLGVSLSEDYGETSFKYFDLGSGTEEWKEHQLSLASLAGNEIRAISLLVEGGPVSDYQLNIGKLAVYNDGVSVDKPNNLKVNNHLLFTSGDSEAIVEFDKVEGADYYVAYAQKDGGWEFLQGSSSNIMYLPNLKRSETMTGKTQDVAVVAVGLNGKISDASTVTLDWGMEVADTDVLPPNPENVVLGASVLGVSHEEDGERAVNALNGTITGNSDKWTSANRRTGWMNIRLTEPRTISRWRVEHAGHGGESVNDGLMNTKNFELLYRETEDGDWIEAYSIRNNIAHVTDVNLDEPITAQDWRLNITTADNGSPWGGIRIYNWMMFETELDSASEAIPMVHVSATNTSENKYDILFRNVPKNTEVEIFKDRELTESLGTLRNDELTDSQTADLQFKDIVLEGASGVVYYHSTTDGLEASPVLAVPYRNSNLEVKNLELKKIPTRNTFLEGEDLDLSGASLLVTYTDGSTEEISLTNPLVTVSGYDAMKLGEQSLSLTFKGHDLTNALIVTVESADKAQIESITVRKSPKLDYKTGQTLDVSAGILQVRYTNGALVELALDHEDIKIEGFDSQTEGEKVLTVTYKDKTTQFSVYVNDSIILNYQRLEQALARAENTVIPSVVYQNASENVKKAFDDVLAEAKELLYKAEDQEQINDMVSRLEDTMSALDGYDFDDPLESVDKPMKLVSIDAGRKYYSLEELKSIVDKLSESGYTHLHLLLGNDGLRFVLDDMSLVYGDKDFTSEAVKEAIISGNLKYANHYGEHEDKESVLTESEMDALLAYAAEKNIGIIPAINSPGHMDTILYAAKELGIKNPNFSYSGKESVRTVDLENKEAVDFTKELLGKYISYFGEKGSVIFNLGIDEYANDVMTTPGWAYLQNNNKYQLFADYVNDLATMVKHAGMRPMAYNDGLYYNSKTDVKFDSDIVIALWTGGWWGFEVANGRTHIAQGHDILNVNDAWYYVLGREHEGTYNRQNALKNMALSVRSFEQTVSGEIPTIGSMISQWADDPSQDYEENLLFEWIEKFVEENQDVFNSGEEPVDEPFEITASNIIWSPENKYYHYDNDGDRAEYMIDGRDDTTSWWAINHNANYRPGEYIGLDLEESRLISQIRVVMGHDGSDDRYDEYKIRISDDKETWTDVSETISPDSQQHETIVTLDPATKARYVVAEAQVSGGTWVKITEFDVTILPDVDKTALKEKIDEVEALELSDYTDETKASVEIALAAANEIYEDPMATKAEVDEALTNLTTAVNNLELIPVEDSTPFVNPIITEDMIIKNPTGYWVYNFASGNKASNMIDGNDDTFTWWATPREPGAYSKGDYIGLDLGKEYELGRFRMVMGGNSESDFFSQYVIKYSSDKENWTSYTAPISQSEKTKITDFVFENVKARYVVVEAANHAPYWVQISEFMVETTEIPEEPVDPQPDPTMVTVDIRYTDESSVQLEVEEGDEFTLPEAPVREGYTLTGYTVEGELYEKDGEEIMDNIGPESKLYYALSDITLTAIWQADEKPATEADISKLEAKLEEAKSIDTTRATEESKQTLLNAIASAESLLEKDKLTQEKVEKATQDLIDAINNLVFENVRRAIGVEVRGLDDKRSNAVTVELKSEDGTVFEGSYNDYKQWSTKLSNKMLAGTYTISLTTMSSAIKAVINETTATQKAKATDEENVFTIEVEENDEKVWAAFKLVVKEDAVQTYPDVAFDHWAYDVIAELSKTDIIKGYSDGNFRPADEVSRAEVAKMIVVALDLEVENLDSPFKDVESSHWAHTYIAAAFEAGIINGYKDNTFRPDNKITRAEASAILQRAFEIEKGLVEVSFDDVPENEWYVEYIDILASNGIILGYTDGSIRPENQIKRAEFAMMLGRVLNLRK